MARPFDNPDTQHLTQQELALRERQKELACIYAVSDIVRRNGEDLDRMLQNAVEVLPGSWLYPEVACARIYVGSLEYVTDNYRPCKWTQSADLIAGDQVVGKVEVGYLEQKPAEVEGPFLREERLLIDAISDRLGRALERLDLKRSLAAKETALQEVLEGIQRQHHDLADQLVENIDKVVMPIVASLGSELSRRQQQKVEMLRRSLQDITSPFVNRIHQKFSSLTPTEIRVCDHLRKGLSSKQIASMERISPGTVSRHRENIRRKLGLTAKKVNLTSYLRSFMNEAGSR